MTARLALGVALLLTLSILAGGCRSGASGTASVEPMVEQSTTAEPADQPREEPSEPDTRVPVKVLVPCGLASGFRDISVQIREDMPDIRFLTKVVPVVEMTDKVLSGELSGDVFTSLGYKEIERLEAAGKLARNSLRNIAQFRLALIAGKTNPHGVKCLEDLLRPEIEHVTMPPPHENSVGYYTQDVLRNAGLWEKLEPKIVYPATSAEVIKYMRKGWADAAVIYDTCLIETYTPTGEPKMARSTVDKVAMIDPSLHPRMYAPAGILVDTKEPDAAYRVIEYLASEKCMVVFEKYSFIPPADPTERSETISSSSG